MQYVKFGQTPLTVSRFGLGCMRFPEAEDEAIAMVRYAIDHGVNYCDTAYVYENSEAILARALRNGYRERINLVTKSNTWGIEKHSDWERFLDEQLLRLGTDHFDVYLLHNLYDQNWRRVLDYDGFGFLDEMVAKGKVRYRGFSMHNTLTAFKTAVDACSWDMAQIQLNILDEQVQIGTEGLLYGAAAGLAMVVMEPLRGGNLIKNMPPAVGKLIAAHPEQRSLADWCFRWLFDKPEVTLILSGTSTLGQLQENLRIFENAQAGILSEAEQDFIGQLRAAFEEQDSIGCTGCGYCLPCPQGVDIPHIFRMYNNNKLSQGHFVDKLAYSGGLVAEGHGADRCISCGACEALCPQQLPISSLLEEAHEALGFDVVGFRRK
ncbi:MAG: aldo/keto reductase [Coriobacteriales bacterium]|jgi:predicted aldo/keto reductase-like oxidoreductase|nr:aldo/keto reductase [Coriobacteriales bacterium]